MVILKRYSYNKVVKLGIIIALTIGILLSAALLQTVIVKNENYCTHKTAYTQHIKPIPSNKFLIMGSVEYVEKIKTIAKESGNSRALSVIMIDVDKNGYELSNNDSDNISRFHKLVSSLVYKIGYVDMQTHYFRNKLNSVPKTLQELISLNKTLPINKRWILVSIADSGYHMQGIDGEYNLKFLSYDGFCEAVFNKKGVLLNENNDPINMGTYNYGTRIFPINVHSRFDKCPYFLWGNTGNSPQKGKDAINKGVHLGLINYKKHATSVYLYRKNLFGMQQGKVS